MKKNIYYGYYKCDDNISRIKKIKETGLDGVFVFLEDGVLELINDLRDNGLEVETIHLPYKNVNNLWCENDDYFKMIINGIEIANLAKVKTVIVHTLSGKNPPLYNELGLNRVKEMIKLGEKYNINIAFENLRNLDYIDYIFDNIKSDKLKMCFDSGHANAFTKNIDTFPFDKYQDKIICLHLHDNDGENDLHLPPFNGNIKWEELIKKLKGINYQGPLTLEIQLNEMVEDEVGFLNELKEKLDKLEEYFIK